jgi:Flp pilus assembly protein TadG
MIGFLKKLWRDKRGNALVIAAAALPLVLGSAGLASDTIDWALWKRQLQRAADSAAIAGVYAHVQGATVTDAVTRDLSYNSHVGITTTVSTTNPPSTGTRTSDNNAVRVALSVQKKLSFSGMFMSATPTISAVGTATIVPSGKYCVISLESTAVTGITATGNADVDLGCGMITNSTSLTAAVATGSSDVNASPVAAVGGIPASTHWGTGTVLQPFTLAQDDPYASINPPALPTGNCPNYRVNSNATDTFDATDANTTGMPSGFYCVGDMNLAGDVTFPSNSVIVIDGGSLNIGSQANVSCTGCTFILTSRTADTNPSSIGNVDINGGATMHLTAPLTTAPSPVNTYAGIMMYQDRRAVDGTDANHQSRLNGNSNSVLQGAYYFPSQQVTFNGAAGMTTNCMYLVARRVLYSGDMHISNTCPADSGLGGFAGKKVRLVE